LTGGIVSDDFQVSGVEDFLKLSKALKAAGRSGVRKELNKGMRNAAKPIIPKIREALREEMPHSGGLGDFLAGKPISVVTRTGSDPGVFALIKKQDPRLESQGRLPHPVFGRKPFVVQQVRSGVVGDAVEKAAPDVLQAIEGVLQTFIDDIAKEVN
jgi:hypothetical protein